MVNLKTYILAQTPHYRKPTNVNNPNGKSENLYLAQTPHCRKPTNENNSNGKSKNLPFSTNIILYKTNKCK